MRTVEQAHHVELHPETDAELNDLRIAYPNLWPFEYVCVQKPFDAKAPPYYARSGGVKP